MIRDYGDLKLRVPHVASWTSESEDVVRMCQLARAEAMDTTGRQGRGDVRWGELHPQRQRRAMYLVRCQVCDIELDLRTARLIVWEGVQRDQHGRMAVMEPWLCEPCCQYALAVCPGIKRQVGVRVLVGPEVLMLSTLCQLDDGRQAISYIKALVIDEGRTEAAPEAADPVPSQEKTTSTAPTGSTS